MVAEKNISAIKSILEQYKGTTKPNDFEYFIIQQEPENDDDEEEEINNIEILKKMYETKKIKVSCFCNNNGLKLYFNRKTLF